MFLDFNLLICNLVDNQFLRHNIEACVSRLRDSNPNIHIKYTEDIAKAKGITTLFLCNSNNISMVHQSHLRSYAVLVSEKVYYFYKDIDKDVMDVLYIDESPDELLKFRLKTCIERIYKDYQSWVKEYVFKKIIDSSPDMVWVKDETGRHVELNKEFCKIVGKSYNFCINKEHPDIWNIPRDEYENSDFACRKSENEILKTGKMGVFEEQFFSNNGIKQFTTYKTPLYDVFGNNLGTCGIGHDVTNFSNLGIELSILVDNLPFPMLICDSEWNPVRINNHFKDIAFIKHEKEFNYRAWKNDSLKPVSEKEYSADGTSSSQEYEITLNGESYRFILIERAIVDFLNNVSGYFCILQDVTYQRMHEESILHAANTDPLTGLYNRRFIIDYMNANKDTKLTLLYMDIDFFKKINDMFGHNRGDEILKETAKAIKDSYPEGICARMGGDEFLVVIPGEHGSVNTDSRNKGLIKKVQSLTKETKNIISISVGKSEVHKIENIEHLINETDKKMYKMKEKHHRVIA